MLPPQPRRRLRMDNPLAFSAQYSGYSVNTPEN
jgi:hypothetical protein